MSAYDDALAKAVYSNTFAGEAVGPTPWLPTATTLNGSTGGVSSGVTINSLGSSYAVAVWAKISGDQSQSNTDNALFGTQNEVLFYNWGHANSAFRGVCNVRSTGGTYRNGGGPVVISADAWHWFAAVVDGGLTTSYLDGAAVGTAIGYAPDATSTNQIQFGQAAANYWICKGELAGAYILAGGTAADIAALYAGPTTAARRLVVPDLRHNLNHVLSY